MLFAAASQSQKGLSGLRRLMGNQEKFQVREADLRFKQQNLGNLRISQLLTDCARLFQQTLNGMYPLGVY